ncbi:MAG: class II aldolase/adducin family protein [Planctomycetes bacterium]|nr:class II aldolase/adducin family protein [Planctomycetota bacterium]
MESIFFEGRKNHSQERAQVRTGAPASSDFSGASETDVREEMTEICGWMYSQGLVAATDGNVSYRIDTDRLIITPSGKPKGHLRPRDMLLCDLKGNLIEGSTKPSSEIQMHITCYVARPEMRAVIHAHPPTAVAFTIAGIPLDACVIPEVVTTFGGIPTVPYTTPTTEEVGYGIRDYISKCDVLMLDRHGSVCVAKSLNEAFLLLEKLEHAAHVMWIAYTLGNVQKLSPEEVAKLLRIREKLGIGTRILPCRTEGGETTFRL